jgi:hypothetical protein
MPALMIRDDIGSEELRRQARNAEGIAGLCDRPKPGRTPKLTEGQMASLKAVVLAGPDPRVDQIGRWRIVDLCRYVEERWEVSNVVVPPALRRGRLLRM